jgi:hypothetical protein
MNVRNSLIVYAYFPNFLSRQSTTIFFTSNSRTGDYKSSTESKSTFGRTAKSPCWWLRVVHLRDVMKRTVHVDEDALRLVTLSQQSLEETGLCSNWKKLVRGALALIFGYLPAELKSWFDAILERDRM